jgi:hypothetical protein
VFGAARICPRKRPSRGPTRPQPPASPGLRALIAVLVLALAAPVQARAQAPAADERARLEAIYGAANEATQAGDFASAADRYAEVLTLLPESRENHEVRALALLDSVAARRQAHARSGGPEQLCRARDLTRDYLLAADAAHGLLARELDGVRQAANLRDELDAQLARSTCPEDQPVAEPAPSPPLRLAPAPTPGPDPRVLPGVILLGVGGLSLALVATGLGLGARAETRLRDERYADPGRDIDVLLGENLIQRGRAGNRLAIVGGVLAAVTLVTGATLLALGKTRPRNARVALLPGGLGLRF